MSKARIFEDRGFVFYEDGVHNMKFNLTLIYGKGNEPKTAEEVESMFPDMLDYSSGEE